MMKKVILLSVLAVSITGCMLDPYYDDDYGGHRDRNGHYDRDWKNRDHGDWKHDRGDRDWRYGR